MTIQLNFPDSNPDSQRLRGTRVQALRLRDQDVGFRLQGLSIGPRDQASDSGTSGMGSLVREHPFGSPSDRPHIRFSHLLEGRLTQRNGAYASLTQSHKTQQVPDPFHFLELSQKY